MKTKKEQRDPRGQESERNKGMGRRKGAPNCEKVRAFKSSPLPQGFRLALSAKADRGSHNAQQCAVTGSDGQSAGCAVLVKHSGRGERRWLRPCASENSRSTGGS